MKNVGVTLFLSIWLTLPGYSQLNSTHNHLRSGDVLIKQQIEYVDPGQAGTNRIWDFSKIKTVNPSYTLSYNQPPLEGDSVYILGNQRFKKREVSSDELIVGTEHNTMYYYHFRGDTLLQTGHENPSVVLAYDNPIQQITYPLNYGQKISSDYESRGFYSGTVAIHTRGTVTTIADAYGKLQLPSGDTLNPVLRIKTTQTIIDIPAEGSYMLTQEDSRKQVETCRWFSKGYRYPVFETVRSINLKDSSEIFKTAFYYPTQDHLYLDTDPENQALLDELWDIDKDKTIAIDPTAKTARIEDYITCELYPNPVVSTLNLKYELKQDVKVSFELYSIEGMPVKKVKAQLKTAGIYYESIDCSNLQSKSYVLRVMADELSVNQVVIKK